jgi:nitroreductase
MAAPTSAVSRPLAWSARAWFVAALASQWIFATYITWVLARPLLLGDGEAVNRTSLITGHVAGDTLGNASLLGHVLAAAVLNAVGLLQLVPWLRRRWPGWHRTAGRAFMTLALVGVASGLYMTWLRGSRLGDVSAIAISLNGVLIVLAVAMAWRLARQRDFAGHRRWAIRAFLLVGGVWMLRLGLMGWILVNQGPNGNTAQLDGPFDVVWVFGCYLVPLAVAELYFRAERAGPAAQRAVAGLLATCAALTLLGTGAAFAFMWLPHF